VALSIPLVLAMTFAAMYYFDIGLHKTSLGALVIALGLLVDDAIIAVEMMAVKLEEGFDRMQAASFAYSTTAFPMLSGTLITAAGFLPIATAKSSTGEYTIAIFQVTVIALLLSWAAAVLFVPLLGYLLLPEKGLSGNGAVHDEHAVYHTRFYQRRPRHRQFCVRQRWLTIAVTVADLRRQRGAVQQGAPAVLSRLDPPRTAGGSEAAGRRVDRADRVAAKRLEAVLGKGSTVWTASRPTSAAARRDSSCRWTSNCPPRVLPVRVEHP
jgi:hypothetical protein